MVYVLDAGLIWSADPPSIGWLSVDPLAALDLLVLSAYLLVVSWYCTGLYAVCQYVSCAWIWLQYILWSPLALLMIPRQYVGCMSILWHLVGLWYCLSIRPICLWSIVVFPIDLLPQSIGWLLVALLIGGWYADIINRIGDCVSMCWWDMCWSPVKDQIKKIICRGCKHQYTSRDNLPTGSEPGVNQGVKRTGK